MNNSAKFFCNKNCEYYPCHKGIEELNCLFCYCPLYPYYKCLGNYTMVKIDGKTVKDCSDCLFPHLPQNYDKLMNMIKVLAGDKKGS